MNGGLETLDIEDVLEAANRSQEGLKEAYIVYLSKEAVKDARSSREMKTGRTLTIFGIATFMMVALTIIIFFRLGKLGLFLF